MAAKINILYCIIANNLNVKSIGLASGSKLLGSLKSRVVYLASSVGIVSTVQRAAQATLQAGWSILLPTANERAQTLSSLLPNTSLETGGLISCETALFDALRSEIVELADIDETFDTPTSQTTIPLLHLIKQLLRNGSSLTQLRLQELKSSCKVNYSKSTTTPSCNLLMRFQRLLIGKIYTKVQVYDDSKLQPADALPTVAYREDLHQRSQLFTGRRIAA
ncbi:hypothetical protein QE152_g5317 [Popillia japonica]|uniref:Uncharacterized protein n=1 Tax=Popillia japonica TaxID=7064 RepID=A0AAW1MPX1_POPJA